MYPCSPFLAQVTNRPVPTIFWLLKNVPMSTVFETSEECTSVHPFWLYWRTYLCPPTLTLVKNVPKHTLFGFSEEHTCAHPFWHLWRMRSCPCFLTLGKNIPVPNLFDSSEECNHTHPFRLFIEIFFSIKFNIHPG